ncbi:MAG: AMP-binding protein [Anaerolineales bacterium]
MKADQYSSLLEVIRKRSIETPQKTAFTIQNEAVHYAELWDRIKKFAGLALLHGIKPGDRVVVCLPNSTEFFWAFYGLQLIEAIPVPIYPYSGVERILNICNLSQASLVVVPSPLNSKQKEILQKLSSKNGIKVISPNATSGVESADIPIPNNPDGIAFIQYTSGSTGNPKGVMITHHNLLTNIQQMVIGMEITPQEIFISWLPVYHDMGLILKTMVPFYLGAVVHLLETNLKDVGTWLQAIQDNKGTFTAAPDFAYRLCLRQIDPEQYDLSSLRVALNAAEPVRYSTIRDFEEAFRIPNTMVAGYGLAEATVGVSMWKPGAAALVDSNGHVSVGKPFPGVDILIVDGGNVLDFGQIGEIAIRSQANSLGYYQNPEQTELLHWRDQYYLSGDLGYLDQERNIFIVSRKKNIIKRAGETISPQEIEEIVDRFPDIRYSAAVGIDSGGIEGEQVYIFAEVRIDDPSDQDVFHQRSVDIVAEINRQLGFRPARVYLLKPRTIPRTYNGKIQYPKLKQLYLQNDLRKRELILYPGF